MLRQLGIQVVNTSDLFGFECPRCQTMISVSADQAGERIPCPNCSTEMIVPGTRPRFESHFDDLFDIEAEDRPPPNPRNIPKPAAPATEPPRPDSGTAPPVESSGIDLDLDPAKTDSSWELLPVEEAEVASLEPAADPFAYDPNGPLRLDDAPGDTAAEHHVRVKCPICESVSFTTSEMVGRQIQCSDCHSMINVVATSTPAQQGPKALDKSASTAPRDELSAFPEFADNESPSEIPEGEEYGLAPATEDLLRPRSDALPPEILEIVNKSYSLPEGYAAGSLPPTASAVPAAMPAAPIVGSSAASIASVRSPVAQGKSGTALLPEVEAPLAPLEPLTVSEQFKWPEKFLCVFKDLNVLAFAGLLTTLLAIGYVVIDFGMGLYTYTENEGNPYRVFGVLTIFMAGGVHFMATLLAAVIINQLIEGAAYKRSVFHPPEFGVMELVNSLLPVAVSFWAGMLPGVVLGQLFGGISGGWWITFATAFGTAFLLAPIGILGAYYNGSPIQILSTEVLQTIRTQTAGWLRFYSWMALWIVLYCFAWIFRWFPGGILGAILCSICQVACVILMGRTVGLLAQSFINFWIEPNDD